MFTSGSSAVYLENSVDIVEIDPTSKEEEVWSRLNGVNEVVGIAHPGRCMAQHNARVEPISLGVGKQTLNTSPPSTVTLPPLRSTDKHAVLQAADNGSASQPVRTESR
ncbi:hypothetical protein LSAT2_001652 [Lamellibrachia satsuma]|nr:hypothetical protein LSAT2_001652 [Lamellibrachia satsuma]